MQTLIKNKKIFLIILGVVIVLGITTYMIISHSSQYYVKVEMVDSRSPDRTLKVYDNDDKEMKYNEIRYLDDTLLCTSYNPSVYYGDIEGVSKLKIVVDNDNIVIAKVVKE